MLKTLRRWFSRSPKPLTFYRFPVIDPGVGKIDDIEVAAPSYVEARRAAMCMVDPGRYLIGSGIAITAGGDTLQ